MSTENSPTTPNATEPISYPTMADLKIFRVALRENPDEAQLLLSSSWVDAINHFGETEIVEIEVFAQNVHISTQAGEVITRARRITNTLEPMDIADSFGGIVVVEIVGDGDEEEKADQATS